MMFFFEKTLLHPKYSLRRQLLLSFVLPTCVILSLVALLAIAFGAKAGSCVRAKASGVLEEQMIQLFVNSSGNVAEQFSAYMHSTNGALQLIAEFTRDRIVGYPEPGWEDDMFVPFFDVDTQRNMYPLKNPPLSLDWNITPFLGEDKAQIMSEYSRESITTEARLHRCGDGDGTKTYRDAISTAAGAYHFQGSCDPSEVNEDAPGFSKDCRMEFNNQETGGARQPTNTSRWLQEKSGDLAVLIKPIFEAQPDIIAVGIYFTNSGAGSAMWYPAHTLPRGTYVSEGCDWMRGISPFTGNAYATDEEIARCHPAGQVVSSRDYNALEQPWFRDCVERSNDFYWYGPYDLFGTDIKLVKACRSIFDRRTGHLIGVVAFEIASSKLSRRLRRSRLNHERSKIAIVQYDGTLFVDTEDFSLNQGATKVSDTGFISVQDFQTLKDSFDFKSEADLSRLTVLDAFQNRSIVNPDASIYTAFPLPLPPTSHDATYSPDFLILHYNPNVASDAINEMDADIKRKFYEFVILSICLGTIGTIVVFGIVWLVSHILTKPLLWIEAVARNIVNHQDEKAREHLEVDYRIARDWDRVSVVPVCTPKTEISLLVSEFRSMLGGFSGDGPSTVAHSPLIEVQNQVTWRSEFHQLYSWAAKDPSSLRIVMSEEDDGSDPLINYRSAFVFPKDVQREQADMTSLPTVPSPPKKHTRRNVVKHLGKKSHIMNEIGRQVIPTRSSLYWWIVVLIAIPLIVTNLLIFAALSGRIVATVPEWIGKLEETSVRFEKDALQTSAYTKASVVETMLQEVVRDLHLLTRLSGWLVFNGIERSNAFVEMEEVVEDCKHYPADDESCPFFFSNRTFCDCKWNDIYVQMGARDCDNFESDTRETQRMFWMVKAVDFDPETGNRQNISTFPNHSTSPNLTAWWDSVDELPGSWKGRNASGYETAYDRIRVSSALSVATVAMYNYPAHLRRNRHDLGSFAGFEGDGGIMGYTGCNYAHATMSHWVSTTGNRAYFINGDHCPLGKYGFDSRCRDWYSAGRQAYTERRSSVYFTPPYTSALDGKIAVSASSPIANPTTNEYVGQTLLDFFPSDVQESLAVLEKLVFMITPKYDATGGDTVFGPGSVMGHENSMNILDLLFQGTSDLVSSPDRSFFQEEILSRIKQGHASSSSNSEGTVEYRKPSENGVPELMHLAYHPIWAPTFLPVDPSNVSRGVLTCETHVYSVGIAASDIDLRQPFSEAKKKAIHLNRRRLTIYLCLVGFLSVLFVIATHYITVYVAKPILVLLRVTQMINAGHIEDDIPPLNGGSKEVHHIYSSFAKLIKVVRMSNIAFFSGNLSWAHDIISDALQLFLKVDDRKAIGIACNNLGNTLYAVLERSGKICQGDETNSYQCYFSAMAHFDEAIRISKVDFQASRDETEKAARAQQLADRLFNRALFGLMACSNGFSPENAKALALQDLNKVRELDLDVRDYLLERKLLLRYSDTYYDRLIRRLNGLLTVYDDVRGYWNPKALVEEADKLLFAAWNEPNATMFDEVSPVGRLQQLEAAAMRLDLLCGKRVDAARLAIRMFVEDEYLIDSAFASAAKSLLELLNDEFTISWSTEMKAACRQDLRAMARQCKSKTLDLGKCVIFALDINEHSRNDAVYDSIQANCLRLYDVFCANDDHVGVLAMTENGTLETDIGLKGDDMGHQRGTLKCATSSTHKDFANPLLPYAVQMVVDCMNSSESETFLVLVCDQHSWNSEKMSAVLAQLERAQEERLNAIHLIILGIGIDDPTIERRYTSLSSLTTTSFYSAISEENVDSTFTQLGHILRGRSWLKHFSQGITMEKF